MSGITHTHTQSPSKTLRKLKQATNVITEQMIASLPWCLPFIKVLRWYELNRRGYLHVAVYSLWLWGVMSKLGRVIFSVCQSKLLKSQRSRFSQWFIGLSKVDSASLPSSGPLRQCLMAITFTISSLPRTHRAGERKDGWSLPIICLWSHSSHSKDLRRSSDPQTSILHESKHV